MHRKSERVFFFTFCLGSKGKKDSSKKKGKKVIVQSSQISFLHSYTQNRRMHELHDSDPILVCSFILTFIIYFLCLSYLYESDI
jgi:hypothetical protein